MYLIYNALNCSIHQTEGNVPLVEVWHNTSPYNTCLFPLVLETFPQNISVTATWQTIKDDSFNNVVSALK